MIVSDRALEQDKLFAGSILEICNRFFVPLTLESRALNFAKRVAKTSVGMPWNDRIEWKQSDAIARPFEDGSFDVIALVSSA